MTKQNLYQNIICDSQYLYEAYVKCCRGKKQKKDVREFIQDWSYNLFELREKLSNKNWEEIFEYYNFTIHRPKERSVDALKFPGRIVQHVLCDNILRPYFEPRLIKANCACREGKGTDYAIKLLENCLKKIYKQEEYDSIYVLKMDIRKYFPSIKREKLKELLKDFPDKEIVGFLYWIIDHCPGEDGLPIGNQTSQWFALYYLDGVDRVVKEKYSIKCYVRYMDDLIIVHHDKELLKKLWQELIVYVKEKLGLEFNEKTQLFPLRRGISFLGWKIRCNKETGKITKKIDASKKHDRFLSIKSIEKDYEEGKITFYDYNIRMQSVVQHLSKGNTYNFRKKHGLYLIPCKQDKKIKKNIKEILN